MYDIVAARFAGPRSHDGTLALLERPGGRGDCCVESAACAAASTQNSSPPTRRQSTREPTPLSGLRKRKKMALHRSVERHSPRTARSLPDVSAGGGAGALPAAAPPNLSLIAPVCQRL